MKDLRADESLEDTAGSKSGGIAPARSSLGRYAYKDEAEDDDEDRNDDFGDRKLDLLSHLRQRVNKR